MNEVCISFHKYSEKIKGITYSGLYEVSHASNSKGYDPQFTVTNQDNKINVLIESILLNRHLDMAYHTYQLNDLIIDGILLGNSND